MRAVIQRVHEAQITIDQKETRRIGRGLVIFLGVMKGDGESQSDFLAEKAFGLRIFPDENGKMNLSLGDVGGQALVVSNFTLGTDCK
ncbi:MAG TPA: D-aminoacyl-tRNA deacylase, partial [Candidatus Acutalibacter pullistercoris]|nr:D-aminoacyl-tRNA deacylase [Candidatus Acutalibacter pullistercoris]